MPYQSVFTIGLPGLPQAEDIQIMLHDGTGSNTLMDWDNQISADGESTVRYTIGLRKGIAQPIHSFVQTDQATKSTCTSEANTGFTTDASAGFNIRWGRQTTPFYCDG